MSTYLILPKAIPGCSMSGTAGGGVKWGCGDGCFGVGGEGGGFGGGCWGGGVASPQLWRGLGDALWVRLPASEVPLPPTMPPRRFLRRVRLREYEDNSRPFRLSSFLRLNLSRCLIGIRDGSKLNVESSRWSHRSFFRSCQQIGCGLPYKHRIGVHRYTTDSGCDGGWDWKQRHDRAKGCDHPKPAVSAFNETRATISVDARPPTIELIETELSKIPPTKHSQKVGTIRRYPLSAPN